MKSTDANSLMFRPNSATFTGICTHECCAIGEDGHETRVVPAEPCNPPINSQPRELSFPLRMIYLSSRRLPPYSLETQPHSEGNHAIATRVASGSEEEVI